jgi:hypothetical protein
MPRTVESIVANHQHASELRRAGKPIWSHDVPIKTLMKQHKAEGAPAIAKLMASQLRLSFRKRVDVNYEEFDSELNGIVHRFDDIATCPDATEDAVAEFDYVIDDLYDWADANRVWLS